MKAKSKGKVILDESKMVTKKAMAVAWGDRRKLEIETAVVTGVKVQSFTIRALIYKYLNDEFGTIGRTKRYTLNMF